MGAKTEISWTDHTFNPFWGCTKVSPACDHCYAETFSKRVGFSETGSKFPIWGKDAERRFFGDKHWAEPLKWNLSASEEGVRKRVFCGSMCDVMEDRTHGAGWDRQTEARERLYDLIDRTPWLDWLLLTKRPQNFRRFLPKAWLESPRPNVWGMTTVESSDYLWRMAALAETPFAVRGLSVEPLLGPLVLPPTWDLYVDWVIVGGESGPGARPMHPNWARSLRDQCQTAGVAFHFKQWGEFQDGSSYEHRRDLNFVVLNDGRFSLGSNDFPQETRNAWSDFRPTMMARVGKKAAGRILDGRTWDEIPTVGQA